MARPFTPIRNSREDASSGRERGRSSVWGRTKFRLWDYVKMDGAAAQEKSGDRSRYGCVSVCININIRAFVCYM